MSDKLKRKDLDPKRWAGHEERDHQAVDAEAEALAECYRILIEAGALKPTDEGDAPA